MDGERVSWAHRHTHNTKSRQTDRQHSEQQKQQLLHVRVDRCFCRQPYHFGLFAREYKCQIRTRSNFWGWYLHLATLAVVTQSTELVDGVRAGAPAAARHLSRQSVRKAGCRTFYTLLPRTFLVWTFLRLGKAPKRGGLRVVKEASYIDLFCSRNSFNSCLRAHFVAASTEQANNEEASNAKSHWNLARTKVWVC